MRVGNNAKRTLLRCGSLRMHSDHLVQQHSLVGNSEAPRLQLRTPQIRNSKLGAPKEKQSPTEMKGGATEAREPMVARAGLKLKQVARSLGFLHGQSGGAGAGGVTSCAQCLSCRM